MKQAHLKKVRVAVALLFLLLTAFVFVDFSNALSAPAVRAIIYLQFMPSLLKFIILPGLAAAGFAFVIILTLLCGRVYCSTVCPLGTLQDIAIRISGRLKKKRLVLRRRIIA